MDTQPLLEAIIATPIDQISRFRARLYEALEEFKAA
jgi:hypothetical protein